MIMIGKKSLCPIRPAIDEKQVACADSTFITKSNMFFLADKKLSIRNRAASPAQKFRKLSMINRSGHNKYDKGQVAQSNVNDDTTLPLAHAMRGHTTPFHQIPDFASYYGCLLPYFPSSMQSDYQLAIDSYKQHILDIMRATPQPFVPIAQLQIGGIAVRFGSPMKLKQYDAIPLYITNPSSTPSTTMVFAYQSKSQDSWRRFAGYALDIYWKGDSEHLQNFDWRIQKALDSVYANFPHIEMIMNGRKMKLSDFSINSVMVRGKLDSTDLVEFIIRSEKVIQDTMVEGREQYSVNDDAKPTHMIDYWWSGDVEDPYGPHINMIVRSERYIYCIAITEDGLFPKLIQPFNGSINIVGALNNGVLVPESLDWVLTPIFEYDSQKAVALEHNGNAERTQMGGGKRVRIRGVHNSEHSPFFELTNGMDAYYRVLRYENYSWIERRLQQIAGSGGTLPLSSTVPDRIDTRGLEPWIESRYNELLMAYNLVTIEPDVELKFFFSLTDRNLSLLKRYKSLLMAWDEESPAQSAQEERTVPLILANRLMQLATQDILDQEDKTV